jgi:hypothetical protein
MGGLVQAESQPTNNSGWAIARRILSLPLLGVGAFLLLTLSISWMAFFGSLPVGLIMFLVIGGTAAAFLAGGFWLWGRKYRKVIAGVVFTGLGCQAALMAGFFVLMLSGSLGEMVPPDFDNETSRAMTGGSVISAMVFLAVGVTLLVPPVRELLRERTGREKPVVVWIVLAWYAYTFVAVLASSLAFLTGLMPVPPGMEEYLEEKGTFGALGSFLIASMTLAGAILLVMRRKIALWLFVAAFVVGLVLSLAIRGFEPPPGYPPVLWAWVIGFGYAVSLVIIAYAWSLYRRGILR